jgi:pimeloyl-ACP methyl ester carboxylesterase
MPAPAAHRPPPRFRAAASLSLSLLAGCAVTPPPSAAPGPEVTMAHSLTGPDTRPVVVLQSGLGDDRTAWRAWWPRLTARHRVFAADRPGYGATPAWDGPHDPCTAARQLHRALRDARVEPPYLLVGHSLGGLYQVAFARMYPQDTAGLLLLDPTHPAHWTTLQRDARPAAAVLAGLRATVFSATMRAEFDAQSQCLDTLPPLPAGLPARLLFSGRFGPVEGPDYQRTLQALRHDWQRQLGAPAETVPDSGHYLQREATLEVNQALEQLLRALPAR